MTYNRVILPDACVADGLLFASAILWHRQCVLLLVTISYLVTLPFIKGRFLGRQKL